MMKALMSATALTALVATSAAYGQQAYGEQPADAPMTGSPPAAMEPAPGMEAQPMAPAPEAAAPQPADSTNQAQVPTLPPPETSTAATEPTGGDAGMFIEQQEPGELLASSLIGATVENPAGETLGDINDVVLTDEGIVDGIVIGVGGFLGIGEKNVAVNFDAIEKTTDDAGNVVLTLNTTEQQLENAPQYVTVAGLRPGQQSAPAPVSNQ